MGSRPKETVLHEELLNVHKALTNGSSEDAKRNLVDRFFHTLFPNVKVESEAAFADIYVEGILLVEIKSDGWVQGFYQALHYLKRGLTFAYVCVIQNGFLGLWKVNEIPERARLLVKAADAHKASSAIGVANAKRTPKSLQLEILKTARFKYWIDLSGDTFEFTKDSKTHLGEWLQQLRNLDKARIQINSSNFINAVEQMKSFFEKPIDAVHAFYAIVGTWDVSSKAVSDDSGDYISVVSSLLRRNSEKVFVVQRHQRAFMEFVERQYIFTNEGSGKTVDYYFSRFDEVMARLDPEYARRHGIYFTDYNLCRFSLWFIHTYFKRLGDQYIVIDPAGGSGNLATSWRGHLKHKVISELQPDLLQTIERRMRYDTEQVQAGYTVIPKTSEHKGLNFLDKSADDYYSEVKKALASINVSMDKSLAFLVNPPYFNSDESASGLQESDAAYDVHPTILSLTGGDAGRERYLAFLGQILNICKLQVEENPNAEPLIMIFTPTSWLIPRPTYVPFRKHFDKHFLYVTGFLITSNEFFEIGGQWPLAFTVWRYHPNDEGYRNQVEVKNYTHFNKRSLDIDWTETIQRIEQSVRPLIGNAKYVKLSAKAEAIKEWCGQPMYDFKRDRTRAEKATNAVVGGLPLSDSRRNNSKTYGTPTGEYIGLMDNGTPVRIKQDRLERLSGEPDRVWFRIDTQFADANKSRIQNCPPDQKGYCAYDLASARRTFTWYAITKAIQSRNPIWSNQFDLWRPRIPAEIGARFYSLCFSYGLAVNSCVVTKFEANNPIQGVPEIYLDNPLSPNNGESFWNTTLKDECTDAPRMAKDLVKLVSELYATWDRDHCKGKVLTDVGLKEEPYFKAFAYPDFVTRHSGIRQIKKFAEVHLEQGLLRHIDEIVVQAKVVRDEVYRMLVEEIKYFEE